MNAHIQPTRIEYVAQCDMAVLWFGGAVIAIQMNNNSGRNNRVK